MAFHSRVVICHLLIISAALGVSKYFIFRILGVVGKLRFVGDFFISQHFTIYLYLYLTSSNRAIEETNYLGVIVAT